MYKGWAIKSSPCTATINDLLCYCKEMRRDALLVLYLMLRNSLFRIGYRLVHIDCCYQFIYANIL
jgi:hypothetical protein